MSATDTRVHFGEVLKAVAEHGDRVIVERAGQQLAAIVSLSDYEHMRSASRWDGFAELLRKNREFLQAEYEAGRLPYFDFAEAVLRGREERAKHLADLLR